MLHWKYYWLNHHTCLQVFDRLAILWDLHSLVELGRTRHSGLPVEWDSLWRSL